MTDTLPVHTGKYRPPKHLIPTISGSVFIGSILFIINRAEDPPWPWPFFGTLVLRIHSAQSTPALTPNTDQNLYIMRISVSEMSGKMASIDL
jgi:hypothetical protein